MGNVLDNGRPNAWNFVGGNAHSDSATTHQDASFGASAGHATGHTSGVIGIIYRVGVVRAQVLNGVVQFREHLA
jgi:hypothetical protein